MRIDVHAHYYPSEYLDGLDRAGGPNTAVARASAAGGDPADLRARFALMDSAGVDMQVLSVSTLFPYVEREATGVTLARSANTLQADVVRRNPKRLAAFGVMPLPHIEATLKEIGHCLDELGMVGVSVGTSVLGRALGDRVFEPVFAELDRRGAVMFIHPAGVGACSPLIPTTGIGPIVEDTMAVMSLVNAGVVNRYPALRIVAPHLGGALPLIADRMDRHHENFKTQLIETPSVTLRRLWYDTVTHGSVAALRCSVSAFGADRLLLGTDFPYSNGPAYVRSVAYIMEARLGDREERAILGERAAELLGTLRA